MSKKDPKIQMIEKFQCPGCVCGLNTTKCDKFNIEDLGRNSFQCSGHVVGTRILGVRSNLLVLGLPKGFNRVGNQNQEKGSIVRLHLNPEKTLFDKFNVAVWAMEEKGYLFVRTFVPRLNETHIDVIKKGTLALVTKAIDVSEFIDDID
jgi:hypothetical protein